MTSTMLSLPSNMRTETKADLLTPTDSRLSDRYEKIKQRLDPKTFAKYDKIDKASAATASLAAKTPEPSSNIFNTNLIARPPIALDKIFEKSAIKTIEKVLNPSVVLNSVLAIEKPEEKEKEKIKMIDIQDNVGETPLMLAIKNGNVQMTIKLIDSGANVNLLNKYGESALICALRTYDSDTIPDVKKKMSTIVEKLITKALINVTDHHYVTTVDLIFKMHADQKIPYDEKIAKALLGKSGTNIQDKNGDTLLMKAILRKNDNFVKYLVDNNADVNLKNNSGHTALNISIHSNNDYSSDLLIAKSANI